MKLVILGLRDKSTGDYYTFDPEINRNKLLKVNFGKKLKIDTLAPYPFSYFSGISFMYSKDKDKYEKCYLEVEGELTKKEFNSMDSSGISYYFFENREITPLREYLRPFQYALEIKKEFKDKYHDWAVVTSLINQPTLDEDEFNAMTKLITIAAHSYKPSRRKQRYSMDIKVDENSIKYLLHLLKLSKEGIWIKLNVARYDEKIWKDTNFSDEELLEIMKAWPELASDLICSLPKFNYNFYKKYIRNTELMDQFFSSVYNIELFVKDGWDIDALFSDRFPYIRAYLLKRLNYESDSDLTLEEIFNDENYQVRIEHTSPLDTYCCSDCDGYDIYDMYTEEELEGEEFEVDDRVNDLTDLIYEWEPYLTSKSKDLFTFIPENLIFRLEENKMYNLISIIKE